MRRQYNRLFWAILSLGMLLRLLWVGVVPVEPFSDPQAYDLLARVLWQHGVYGFEPDQPSAYWAVGTAAIAAATYFVTQGGYAGIVALNLLASALLMICARSLGERWFGTAAGLVAMAVVALWPNLIYFTSVLSSELFFMALVAAGLVFWRRTNPLDLRDILICGIIWGLACYIRPVILLLPIALALVDFPGGLRVFARSSLRAGFVLGLILLTVLPWSERNHAVFGERVMMSTNLGPNLWMGNNPESTGGYMPLPPEVAGMSEIARADYLKTLAVDYMVSNPLQTVQRTLVKAIKLHDRETIGVVWNEAALTSRIGANGIAALKALSTAYWYAVLALSFTALGILWRRHGLVAAVFHPATAVWMYFTLVHAVIVVGDRYHMPSSPILALLAGHAVSVLFTVRKQRRDERRFTS